MSHQAPLNAIATSDAEEEDSTKPVHVSIEDLDAHDLYVWASLISLSSSKLPPSEKLKIAIRMADEALVAKLARMNARNA